MKDIKTNKAIINAMTTKEQIRFCSAVAKIFHQPVIMPEDVPHFARYITIGMWNAADLSDLQEAAMLKFATSGKVETGEVGVWTKSL